MLLYVLMVACAKDFRIISKSFLELLKKINVHATVCPRPARAVRSHWRDVYMVIQIL